MSLSPLLLLTFKYSYPSKFFFCKETRFASSKITVSNIKSLFLSYLAAREFSFCRRFNALITSQTLYIKITDSALTIKTEFKVKTLFLEKKYSSKNPPKAYICSHLLVLGIQPRIQGNIYLL